MRKVQKIWTREEIAFRIPEANEKDIDLIERSLRYSMAGPERMWALITALRYVVDRDIPGDVVEFGVWRGGSAFAMCSVLQEESKLERRVWLFDTFSGMTSPEAIDVRHDGLSAERILTEEASNRWESANWAVASLPEVKALIRSSGIQMSRVNFVTGDVLETLASSGLGEIALARLDTDWFQSTLAELEFIHPRMSTAGIVIADDYGHWKGARQAIELYLQRLPRRPLLHRLDRTGRLWVVE